jgi:hypothetical protein
VDLAFREGLHAAPVPLVPGEVVEVEVVLDACAHEWRPGQRLRVSIAGADWPNTVAPPAPVTLAVHGGELDLPLLVGSHPTPTFAPGAERSAESGEGVTWRVEDDVLSRTTRVVTGSETAYDAPHGARVRESYSGTVSVDRRTHAQRADAVTTFAITWPGTAVAVTSTLAVETGPAGGRVTIETVAHHDGRELRRRVWERPLR